MTTIFFLEPIYIGFVTQDSPPHKLAKPNKYQKSDTCVFAKNTGTIRFKRKVYGGVVLRYKKGFWREINAICTSNYSRRVMNNHGGLILTQPTMFSPINA